MPRMKHDRLVRADSRHVLRVESIPAGNYRLIAWSVQIYAVFADGRLWNVRRGEWLKPDRDKDGYLCYQAGKAHRLVLFAFVGPPPFKGAQGRHLDDNPSNNNISNLVWGTGTENWEDRKRHRGPSGGNVSQAGIPRLGAGNFRRSTL